MKNLFLIILFSLVLLICTAGQSSAAVQQPIDTGGNKSDGFEPNLWDIMSLPGMTGQTITQTWVNTNQSGQYLWFGDVINISAYSSYSGSSQSLSWGTASDEAVIFTEYTDGNFFDVDITFNPNGEPWWFMDTATYIGESVYTRTISPDSFSYNMVAFAFDGYNIVAFEDLTIENDSKWRDADYQDLVVKFSIVPEPVSSILFIIGGAAFGFRHFRSNKRNTRTTA